MSPAVLDALADLVVAIRKDFATQINGRLPDTQPKKRPGRKPGFKVSKATRLKISKAAKARARRPK